METLLEKLKGINVEKLDYESLFDYILPFDPLQINYKDKLPSIVDPNEYARNILMLYPIELVLIHWPPGVESAVHLHEGFWGYVGVLSGAALNYEYTLDNKTLKQRRIVTVKEGGLIPEPDGVIHKIANASSNDPLVTLHFYFPPLKDLDRLKLFDTNGTIVELNEKAPSASLHLPKDNYRSYLKDQFSFEDGSEGKTHLTSPILPKPGNQEIKEMIQSYYMDQAKHYDVNDLDNEWRKKYVYAINDLLIDEFKINKPNKVLAIASGTGRRAAKIKRQAGLDYQLFGVDLSKEMCELSIEKGVNAICADWLDVDLPDNEFDVITMLYAFGHVPSARERIEFLEKVHQKLKTGGAFYLDVFNINDPHEWGSLALNVFKEYNLDYFGYERGDVFYRLKGKNEIAFLHYFDKERLIALLKSIGFDVEWVETIGYVYRSGEHLHNEEGKLFIKAVKR